MKKITITQYEEVQKTLDEAVKRTIEILEKLKNGAQICKCCYEEIAEEGSTMCKACNKVDEIDDDESIDELLERM